MKEPLTLWQAVYLFLLIFAALDGANSWIRRIARIFPEGWMRAAAFCTLAFPVMALIVNAGPILGLW